jgi:carboxyl-terminal processing protease
MVLSLALVAVGVWLGGHPDRLPGFIRDALVDDDETRMFERALNVVSDTYYRKVPRDKLADAAIHGMVEDLGDPYSRYLNPQEFAHFRTVQSRQFSGVGVVVGHDRRGLRVLEVYANSPAERAGLREGDLIVAAGGKSLAGRTQQQAVALVKGPEGTAVRLRIVRDGKAREVRVVRREITVPAVRSAVVTRGKARYGVIRIASFGSEDVDSELRTALRRLKRRGVHGLVLDLRSNPGGLITQAQLVASEFIKKGVIVKTRGRAVPPRTLEATGDASAPDIPLVVLVDRNSASAAEIVAGALQDHRRAKLVGTRTYGKGVFQQLILLPNGGALDLTAGQYFTPKGRNLGGPGTRPGQGLKPDVSASDDPKTDRDEALDVALRTLASQAR